MFKKYLIDFVGDRYFPFVDHDAKWFYQLRRWQIQTDIEKEDTKASAKQKSISCTKGKKVHIFLFQNVILYL